MVGGMILGRKFSFIARMMVLVLAPMLLLGIIFSCSSTIMEIELSNNLMKEQLESTAHSVLEHYRELDDGNYKYTDGKLVKGKVNISNDQDFIKSIKDNSRLYVTLFYGDTRAVSSIIDENGKSVVGTKADEAVVDKVLNNGEEYYTDDIKIEGIDCCAVYIPIKNAGSNETVGMVFVGKETTLVNEEINKIIVKSLLIDIICMAVVVLVAYYFIKKIVNALKCEEEQINTISNGKLVYICDDKYLNRTDEIGDMVSATKNLVKSLREIVKDIINGAKKLNEFSNKYKDAFDQMNSSIENVNYAVSEMADVATTQAHDSQDVNGKIISMGSSIDSNVKNVEKLEESSDKMREYNRSVDKTLNSLMEISYAAKTAVEDVSKQTKMTNDSAEEIRLATQLISEIAEQTNLLSLNASIEAARAGEAGKGFVVVAEEIRKLADQSRESSEKISQIVEKLINDSNTTVSIMKDVDERISKQTEQLNGTKDMFIKLKEEINNVLSAVENIFKENTVLNKLKDDSLSNVESLAAAAQENAASTEETSASMEEVKNIISDCRKSVDELVELAEELSSNAEKFTLI